MKNLFALMLVAAAMVVGGCAKSEPTKPAESTPPAVEEEGAPAENPGETSAEEATN